MCVAGRKNNANAKAQAMMTAQMMGVLKDFLAGAELVSVMADINGKW
ncbi:hypothetical protein [Moraxella lacunata]